MTHIVCFSAQHDIRSFIQQEFGHAHTVTSVRNLKDVSVPFQVAVLDFRNNAFGCFSSQFQRLTNASKSLLFYILISDTLASESFGSIKRSVLAFDMLYEEKEYLYKLLSLQSPNWKSLLARSLETWVRERISTQ